MAMEMSGLGIGTGESACEWFSPPKGLWDWTWSSVPNSLPMEALFADTGLLHCACGWYDNDYIYWRSLLLIMTYSLGFRSIILYYIQWWFYFLSYHYELPYPYFYRYIDAQSCWKIHVAILLSFQVHTYDDSINFNTFSVSYVADLPWHDASDTMLGRVRDPFCRVDQQLFCLGFWRFGSLRRRGRSWPELLRTARRP